MQRIPEDFSAAARGADENAKLYLVKENPQQLQRSVGDFNRPARVVRAAAWVVTTVAVLLGVALAAVLLASLPALAGTWVAALPEQPMFRFVSSIAPGQTGKAVLVVFWGVLVADSVIVWRYARSLARRQGAATADGLKPAAPMVGTIRDASLRRYGKRIFAVVLVDLPTRQVLISTFGDAKEECIPPVGSTVWAWQMGPALLVQAQEVAIPRDKAAIQPLFDGQ